MQDSGNEKTALLTRRYFSLMEMVMVMGVIMLLLGFTIGALPNLLGRKGADGGARMLSRQLFLCRQHAIINRRKVALLLPRTAELTDDEFGLYRDVGMRPCIVDGLDNFVEFIGSTKWETVPDRTYIKITTSGTPPPPWTTNLSEVDDVPFGSGPTLYTVTAVIFKSNGSLTVASDIENLVVEQMTDRPNPRSLSMTVNWLTGRTTYDD